MKKTRNNQKKIFNSLQNESVGKTDYLHQLLKRNGVNFASGVPCGVLSGIISNLLNDSEVLHIAVNRESEAVGVAAGSYLSGKIPVVYMQNSGLFASSNDIASLLIPYKIPILFIVSYRGCKGEDAIQHLTTGKATEKLIKSFGLYYLVFRGQGLEDLIAQLYCKMEETSLPVMLLLKRGWNK
jgi:sulfopyruvate decarboxylase alpha subunit